jgi:hypothetical protein
MEWLPCRKTLMNAKKRSIARERFYGLLLMNWNRYQKKGPPRKSEIAKFENADSYESDEDLPNYPVMHVF